MEGHELRYVCAHIYVCECINILPVFTEAYEMIDHKRIHTIHGNVVKNLAFRFLPPPAVIIGMPVTLTPWAFGVFLPREKKSLRQVGVHDTAPEAILCYLQFL